MSSEKSQTPVSIEQIYEQLNKDGKQMPLVSTKQFLLTAGIGVPLYLGLILPLAVATSIGKAVLSSSSKPTISKDDEETEKTEIFPTISDLTSAKERKYDLVLLGATGFAGKLAAEHLVTTYGVNRDVKWAIAGRSKSKLEATKAEIAKIIGDESILKVDTIIADSSVRTTLHDLVKDTRTVATAAGPFELYGSPVVEFCAKYGTNYVDITGEADWHKDMIMKWDETAQKTGAKIISFCGCDSIPWDMSVYKMAQALSNEFDDDLAEAQCLDDMVGGGPSGGTLATVLYNLDGQKADKVKYPFNPLFKRADGSKSEFTAVGESVLLPGKVKGVGKFRENYEGPFVMSSINTEVIKRSQALRSKGNKNLKYRESLIFQDFKTAFVNWFTLVAGGTLLLTPIRDRIIPKPGEGPSRKVMEEGYLTVAGFGVGSKGNKVETLLYFPKEVGYRDTGRLLAESGLCLSLDQDKLPVKTGGFFTPSTGMGDALLDRMCNTGCMFASRLIKSKL